MNKRIAVTIGGGETLCKTACLLEYGNDCLLNRIGLLEDPIHNCPKQRTHIQIELSPATAPTRKELSDKLEEAEKEFRWLRSIGTAIDDELFEGLNKLLARCDGETKGEPSK